MSTAIPGIHHVTAITGNPQQNVDFYTGVLGLRLVKLTVNFDDPGAYHLYYGDAVGHPGTILTFFAWPGAPGGRPGTGQVGVTSFSIPQAAVEYWRERLGGHGVHVQGLSQRFDEQALAFTDPDGLMLELVAHPWTQERPGWDGGPVPAAHAIRGLHAITLWEDGYERTAAFLTDTLGFRPLDHHGSVVRFTTGEGGPGAGRRAQRAGHLAGPGGRGDRAPCGLAHAERRRAAGLAPGDRGARRRRHPGAGPPVLPLHLLPGAGRCALRDCH